MSATPGYEGPLYIQGSAAWVGPFQYDVAQLRADIAELKAFIGEVLQPHLDSLRSSEDE